MAKAVSTGAGVGSLSKDFRVFTRQHVHLEGEVRLFELIPSKGRYFTMSDGEFETVNDVLIAHVKDLAVPLSAPQPLLLSFLPPSVLERSEPGEFQTIRGHCEGEVKGFGRPQLERLLALTGCLAPRAPAGASASAPPASLSVEP